LRKLLAYGLLLGALLWLVLSYLPESMVALPILSFPEALNPMFQRLLIFGAALFLALQLWLLLATGGLFRPGRSSRTAANAFQLTLPRELFWTALPILMTIVLALASLRTWYSLSPPAN
jgi:heme/copper-type cytochrome/quinol oxidase subunit 2